MSKKAVFIVTYLAVVILVWIYQANWGPMASHSAMHNLGRSLVWPFLLFPTLGNLVGGIILVGLIVVFFAL